MKTIFAFLCLLALLSQSQAMDDQQISALLVGHWRILGQVQMYNGTARYVLEATYHANGRFDMSTAYAFPNGSQMVSWVGTWEIEDGILSTQVERVIPAEAAGLYSGGSNHIEFIDRNSWREDGSDQVYRRE
jgi:hypothetical protein